MTAGKRIRLGRTPPRILRNTDGDSYAIEAHEDPSELIPDSPEGSFAVQLDYDDGNGMWISTGVSRDLSTCLEDGVRRSASLTNVRSQYHTPIYSRLRFRTLKGDPG